MPKIKLPSLLEDCSGGLSSWELKAADLDELLKELISDHPKLKSKLYDQEGNLNKFINIYVNQDPAADLKNKVALGENDIVRIIVPIAGG